MAEVPFNRWDLCAFLDLCERLRGGHAGVPLEPGPDRGRLMVAAVALRRTRPPAFGAARVAVEDEVARLLFRAVRDLGRAPPALRGEPDPRPAAATS